MVKHIHWGLIGFLLILCLGIGFIFDMDVVTYYFAGRFAHYDITKVYEQNWDLGRFFYGPILLPFLEPFARVPYPYFKWFTMAVDTTCFVIVWKFLERFFPKLWTPSMFLGWLTVWLVSVNPFHHHFQSHNIQVFLAGLIFGGEWLTRLDSEYKKIAGGFLVAVAGMIKLFPLFIVVFYLVAKSKEVRWGVFLGLAFSILFPFLYFGPSDATYLFTHWISSLFGYHEVPQAANDLVKARELVNLQAVVERFFPPGSESHFLSLPIRLSLTFLIPTSFFYTAYRFRNSDEDKKLILWSIACALMVILNPGTRIHFYMFLLPAFAALFVISAQMGFWFRNFFNASGFLSMCLMALTTDFVVGKHWNNHFEDLSIPTWGAIIGVLLLCMALWELMRNSPAENRYT